MEPAIDPDAKFDRIDLDGTSWIDIARGWLLGADTLYDFLESSVRWQADKVWRYEKYVESPRLGKGFRTQDAPHPIINEAQRAIEKRYHARFESFGLQYYRNNRDSVAMHRDREMKWLDDTIVAILTTGARRPFLVQRRDTRVADRDLSPAAGDLMVFGGRFQADWLHGVPKIRPAVRGRISVQWRFTSKTGRRDTNTGFYAPREFST